MSVTKKEAVKKESVKSETVEKLNCEPVKGKAVKADQTAAAEKDAPVKKQPPKKTIGERSFYGHQLNTGAAKIDEGIVAGKTITEMIAEIGCSRGRFHGHLSGLKRKGFNIVIKDDKITVSKKDEKKAS